MMHLSTVQFIAVSVLPLLFAITVHEVAHGWVASKLGDKTALIMGRLTLNPIKHIDLVGTILVPGFLLLVSKLLGGGAFVFGWAKPVPVNFNNLRHPRRDMALVAAAGPCSNLLMALIWAVVAKVAAILYAHQISWVLALAYMGQMGILLNILLMVLNLIPIPPLDGGRIVSALLPEKIALQYNRLEPYGIFILLFLFVTRIFQILIFPLVLLLAKLILLLFGF